MAALPQPFVTPEQYVEIECKAEVRSEYLSGQMFAMAGGSPEHSAVAANIIGEVRSRLKGKSCQTYTSDLRVTIMQTGLKTYPDVTIVCGEAHFHPLDKDSLINPTVIVEVLSDSTEAYDRGGKWAHYQRLDSLQEYVLVSQDQPRVEKYLRQPDGQWLYSRVDGLEAVVVLEALRCGLPLAEVYDRVTFAPGEVGTRMTGEQTT